jgi:beta-lactamase superfamily II metal-dependent hydrolase
MQKNTAHFPRRENTPGHSLSVTIPLDKSVSSRYDSSKDTKEDSAMAKRRSTRRYHRRKKHLTLPLLLLLCFLAYFFPEQSAGILGKLGAEIPAVSRLTSIFSREKSQATVGSEGFEVHFLDVGEGLSVLVRSDDHALLYDGGDKSHSSFVVSYLQNQGIQTLDYVIASHYDSDHLSGLIGALHAFDVEHVLGPDYDHGTATYRSFLSAVSDNGLTVEHPSPGDMYTLGDAGFTVLAPASISDDSNNNSIVIRLVNGNNSFLLMGDAEYASETAMCASSLSLRSDVICPAHHGSSDATGTTLLSQVSPKFAVISCGADNDYGHPHAQTLQRLANAGVTVYRTDESGTIVACSDGDEIWWKLGVR